MCATVLTYISKLTQSLVFVPYLKIHVGSQVVLSELVLTRTELPTYLLSWLNEGTKLYHGFCSGKNDGGSKFIFLDKLVALYDVIPRNLENILPVFFYGVWMQVRVGIQG